MNIKKEWNESGVPRARFFSFRTYGTWLHGDNRGSVDRNNNLYGARYYPPDHEWKEFRLKQLKGASVKLDSRMRMVVRESIKETCNKRNWTLLAVNVRTNHVHAVVNIGMASPSQALNALKANATRELRDKGKWKEDHSPWVRKGSKRPLWTDQDVSNAVEYVLFGQGPDLD